MFKNWLEWIRFRAIDEYTWCIATLSPNLRLQEIASYTFHIGLRASIMHPNILCVHILYQAVDVSNKGRIEEDVRKLVERLNPDKSLFDRLMSKGVLLVEEYNALIEVDQDKENLLKILSRIINTRRTFNSFLAVLIESDQYFHVTDATVTRYSEGIPHTEWIVQTITFKLWDETQFKCVGLFYWFEILWNITIQFLLFLSVTFGHYNSW